eukprot:COSAG04_NODE_17801_length_458_cov_1.420613_1_plen_105_part_10
MNPRGQGSVPADSTTTTAFACLGSTWLPAASVSRALQAATALSMTQRSSQTLANTAAEAAQVDARLQPELRHRATAFLPAPEENTILAVFAVCANRVAISLPRAT